MLLFFGCFWVCCWLFVDIVDLDVIAVVVLIVAVVVAFIIVDDAVIVASICNELVAVLLWLGKSRPLNMKKMQKERKEGASRAHFGDRTFWI